MKNSTKNFPSRLDLCCGSDELRPWSHYVHFTGGFAFASDLHIIIMQDLKFCGFTDEEMKITEGKALHKDAFRLLFKADSVDITEQGFNTSDVIYKWGEFAGNPPDLAKYTSDLGATEYSAQPNIGIKPKLLNLLTKAMISETGIFKMTFPKDNHAAILVTSAQIESTRQLGVIMPCNIDETHK